jgi:hypothetical protein
MVIDYTITVGNIIEIASIVGGGILVLLTLKGDVTALKEGAKTLQSDLEGVQQELKKIGDVLITQADQNRRILHVEEELRLLRMGRGFIQDRSAGGIDGPYP